MRKEIVINNHVYKPAEIDFNAVCMFEEMGIPISNAKGRDMSLLRAYLALCMNKPAENAGAELEAHVLSGGDISELASTLAEAIDESGFFRALRKETEKETPAQEEKRAKKE